MYPLAMMIWFSQYTFCLLILCSV